MVRDAASLVYKMRYTTRYMDTFDTQKPKVTPKDFFLWLGSMAALYVSVVSFITLLFNYINYAFPDVLEAGYYYDPYSGGIRFAIASLIVIFPVYLVLTRMLNQDIRRNPGKRDLWVRKWIIFLTLFAAGITLVVDLITLIYYFLEGDITTRFILKVLVVLIVIGAGFLYYLADLRGRWERKEGEAKLIGIVAGLVVLIGIVSGFFIIGSPAHARLVKLDMQKTNDLQTIQWQVVNYYQQKGELPASLAQLADPISGAIVPQDPQSGASYGYRVVNAPYTFELCATFNEESAGGGDPRIADPSSIYTGGIENPNWGHAAGEVCFERTIDPERYPLVTKPVR